MYELIHKKYLLYFFLIFSPSFCFAQIQINEIFYSPKSRAWIEVYNNSDASVDLSSYKIIDASVKNGHGINPPAILPAHTYGVIGTGGTSGAIISFGSVSFPLFQSALNPATSGDTYILNDASKNEVDRKDFSSSDGANGDGNSLQRQPDGVWLAAAPTPGAVNSNVPIALASTTPIVDNTIDNTQTNNANLSSHTSYVEVSTYKPPEMLSVTIGRNRLASTGIPTEFEAKSNITVSNVSYHWTFGDGASAEGRRVEHVYEYAGDYVVVMNAKYFEDVSVSRTNIKVTEPKLSIEEANNSYIKIKNNSTYEINLYGWKLYFEGKAFVFPIDTIILPLASIEFSSGITGFHPNDLSQVILSTNDKPVISNISSAQTATPKIDQLSELYKKAVQIKNELASLETNELNNTQTKVATTESKKEINLNNLASPIVSISSTTEPINNWFSTFKRFLFKRN